MMIDDQRVYCYVCCASASIWWLVRKKSDGGREGDLAKRNVVGISVTLVNKIIIMNE
jgi:hypothetical protein